MPRAPEAWTCSSSIRSRTQQPRHRAGRRGSCDFRAAIRAETAARTRSNGATGAGAEKDAGDDVELAFDGHLYLAQDAAELTLSCMSLVADAHAAGLKDIAIIRFDTTGS